MITSWTSTPKKGRGSKGTGFTKSDEKGSFPRTVVLSGSWIKKEEEKSAQKKSKIDVKVEVKKEEKSSAKKSSGRTEVKKEEHSEGLKKVKKI